MKDSDTAPSVLAREHGAARTEAERRLWMRIRGRQPKGAKFQWQHPIVPYFADFFCLEARLVIELDGSQHGEKAEQRADERRTAYLERQGYRVLRFWNQEVLDNIDGVLQKIAEYL